MPRQGQRRLVRTGAGEGANLAGTDAGIPGPTRWNFQWVAPQTFSAITFYFAGAAADNSGTVQGDFVYTRSVTLQATAVELATWGRIKRLSLPKTP